MCGCLSHAPYWGPGSQPRHVPRLEIEPATPWFVGSLSITEQLAMALPFSFVSFFFFFLRKGAFIVIVILGS